MRSTARFALIGVVLLGILFLLPFAGWAVDGYTDTLPAWTHTGSACTVDESSLDLFYVDWATLKFKTGKTGTLVARCNILNPLDEGNPNWNGLIVEYLDPDGKGTAYRVRVFLKGVARSSGTVWTLATFDSNAFATTSRVEHLKTFGHSFNFLNFEYFAEIWIERMSTNGAPYLKAVRIAHVFETP